MSEDNIATPGNDSYQLQAPGPGFDCTGIMEQVIEQTSVKHANTMASIANTMENQQQRVNKIADILAGISQFLMQGNEGQNTPNNEVPPSTSQQQLSSQNTPERVPPLTTKIMIRATKQTRWATTLHLGFCAIQVIKFHPHALTVEKRVTRHCLLQPQIYFFRVMRMRFVKLYIHVVQKKITTILVLQAVHMMRTRNTGFSPQKNI